MATLTQVEFANWMSLYAATALCCALAATLSVVVLLQQLGRERPWSKATTWQATALLLPQTWWRWQKLYLLSTPVTLAIVSMFGLSLSWS